MRRPTKQWVVCPCFFDRLPGSWGTLGGNPTSASLERLGTSGLPPDPLTPGSLPVKHWTLPAVSQAPLLGWSLRFTSLIHSQFTVGACVFQRRFPLLYSFGPKAKYEVFDSALGPEISFMHSCIRGIASVAPFHGGGPHLRPSFQPSLSHLLAVRRSGMLGHCEAPSRDRCGVPRFPWDPEAPSLP